MKKLLLAFLLLSFFACSKKDDTPVKPNEQKVFVRIEGQESTGNYVYSDVFTVVLNK